MGDFQTSSLPLHNSVFTAPIKLESLAKLKAQWYKTSMSRSSLLLLSPILAVLVDRSSASHITELTNSFKDLFCCPTISFASMLIGFEPQDHLLFKGLQNRLRRDPLGVARLCHVN
jgi:hypothetical protein